MTVGSRGVKMGIITCETGVNKGGQFLFTGIHKHQWYSEMFTCCNKCSLKVIRHIEVQHSPLGVSVATLKACW